MFFDIPYRLLKSAKILFMFFKLFLDSWINTKESYTCIFYLIIYIVD